MHGYTIMADAFTQSALPESAFGLRVLSNPALPAPATGGAALSLITVPSSELRGPCNIRRGSELFR